MSSFLNRIIPSRKKSPSKAQTSTMKNIFKRSLANFRQSRARIHDVATQRTATPTDTRHRTATPTETRHRTATQRTATPTSSASRTATPSVIRPVQQEALNKLNTTRSESIALNTLNSKRINTQNEINKISGQIHSLKLKIIGAKKAEKDEYENTITNLEASKLALEKKLAVIKRNLQSAMETIQKKHPKKGGTRKRRKYAKKY